MPSQMVVAAHATKSHAVAEGRRAQHDPGAIDKWEMAIKPK